MPLLVPDDLHPTHRHRRRPRTQLFSRNPFRRRRHHASLPPHVSHDPANQPKPIYIYPGLLRIVRDKAIALDNQCPAVLYKCRECRRSPAQHPEPPCTHQTTCSICLDEFHSKDLVRKLPCNVNHVFHSKCILDWFISHHRCPLCNAPVISSAQTRVPSHRGDHPSAPPNFQGVPPDTATPYPDLRRARSYRTLPNVTMDRSRDTHIRVRDRRASDFGPRERPPQPRESSPVQIIDEQPCQEEASPAQKLGGESASEAGAEKTRRKSRGPRTYSYIVHDNVRMEMNPVIPV